MHSFFGRINEIGFVDKYWKKKENILDSVRADMFVVSWNKTFSIG